MASVGATGDTAKLLQMIHVSDEFALPITWDAWDSYDSNNFTVDTVFNFLGRVA